MHFSLSINQACSMVAIHKSTYYYIKKPKDDSPVIEALNMLLDNYPTKGTVRHYDNEGKVTEIIYSDKIIKNIYTPTEKIEKTFNRKTNDIFTEKSIYDKNMKLIKILKFKNGKQYSIYLI